MYNPVIDVKASPPLVQIQSTGSRLAKAPKCCSNSFSVIHTCKVQVHSAPHKISYGDRGSNVVKVLCYKSEGRWFDPSLCHWNFSSFRSLYGPGVDLASNRNEYQNYFLGVKSGRCVRLTTLPPSCAVVTKSGSLNFLEPSGPVQACNGTALHFTKYYTPTCSAALDAYIPVT